MPCRKGNTRIKPVDCAMMRYVQAKNAGYEVIGILKAAMQDSDACRERGGRTWRFYAFVAVDVLSIWRYTKEQKGNLLEDRAVVRTRRRDWRKSSQECNRALKQTIESINWYQALKPLVVVCGRQYEHVPKLPT